ncbi:hypothetical protein A9Q81_13180 [Gammaproteobacteria bacterium 42_54_T18]|nr:hypothetical protein A9Q81_13180 [Gammaproteobacteria bacterium 42_54_T18]
MKNLSPFLYVFLLIALLPGCVNLASVEKIGKSGEEWGAKTSQFLNLAEESLETSYRLEKVSSLDQLLDMCKPSGFTLSVPCPSYYERNKYRVPVKLMRDYTIAIKNYLAMIAILASDAPLEEIKKSAEKFNSASKKADDAWVEYNDDDEAHSNKDKIDNVSEVVYSLSSLYMGWQRDRALREIIKQYHPVMSASLTILSKDLQAVSDDVVLKRESIMDKSRMYASGVWAAGADAKQKSGVLGNRMLMMERYHNARELYDRSAPKYVCPLGVKDCKAPDKVDVVVVTTDALNAALTQLYTSVSEDKKLNKDSVKAAGKVLSQLNKEYRSYKKSLDE